MALAKCKECGAKVSTEAHACPKCGAPPPPAPPAKPPTSTRTKVFAGALIFTVVAVAMAPKGDPMTPEQQATASASAASEAESRRAASAAHDLRRQAARRAAAAIKTAMRDPESLKFESMRVSSDASVICAEYRAKNGFGGMNKEFISFNHGTASKASKTWNKLCTGQLFDLTDVVS